MTEALSVCSLSPPSTSRVAVNSTAHNVFNYKLQQLQQRRTILWWDYDGHYVIKEILVLEWNVKAQECQAKERWGNTIYDGNVIKEILVLNGMSNAKPEWWGNSVSDCSAISHGNISFEMECQGTRECQMQKSGEVTQMARRACLVWVQVKSHWEIFWHHMNIVWERFLNSNHIDRRGDSVAES